MKAAPSSSACGRLVATLLLQAAVLSLLAGVQGEALANPHAGKLLAAEEVFLLRGSPEKPFRQPTDVAVGLSSRIYVLDGMNGRVVVFGAEGEHLFSFGTPGSEPGKFHMAVGIGTAPDGRGFVADTGNHRIQVFSAKGKFLHAFGLKTGGKADPTDVLPSPFQDFCYVSDNDNHEIQVYDGRNGRLLFSWGKQGTGRGEFSYPATLAMDTSHHVYVVDVMNARLQSFDAQGEHGLEVATWGVGPSGLFRPKGVAVDLEGKILVSDSYMGWVKVFRGDGEFEGVVGTPEGEPLRFTTPASIATDGLGRICVVETRASRVSVLRWAP